MDVYGGEQCDDQVVLLTFKLLFDLVDNSSSRLKFDAWSINGLIVFKESVASMGAFLQKYQCLSSEGKPLRHNDRYKEIYKYLKVFVGMMLNFLRGKYINFAICEYYQDQSLTQISQQIFQSILNQDAQDMSEYKKLHRTIFTFIEEFFKSHLELIFLRFDFNLLILFINKALMPAMKDHGFDIKSSALAAADSLNHFMFENLRKPSRK